MKNCRLTPAKKKTANKKADIAEFAGLAAPARRTLVGAGYKTLAQAAKAKESDLAKLHGLGFKSLKILKALLAEKGLKPARA